MLSGIFFDPSKRGLDTNTWYDNRGNVIKQQEPGGLVTTYTHDGAGRVSKIFQTDGASDTTWMHAGSVSDDDVGSGNVLQRVYKQRFHIPDTRTGPLGDRNTAPRARVSYTIYYYDKADRRVDPLEFAACARSPASANACARHPAPAAAVPFPAARHQCRVRFEPPESHHAYRASRLRQRLG